MIYIAFFWGGLNVKEKTYSCRKYILHYRRMYNVLKENTYCIEGIWTIHSEGQDSITNYVEISFTSGMTGIISRCMAYLPVFS